ncbi:MAG TPA: isoleucine--tRNA ligase [Victivallales bacterium]|nr:isoleucine--tRNA ligase [Victivallales bacterium]
MSFSPVSPQTSFPALEEEILKFWEENKIFQKSLDSSRAGKEFVFYDGPPFATGLPHYGHLLAGTIKDVVPRYQTMRGKFVDRVFGWDCHGLPVEYEMEKELALSGKNQIEEFGIGKFNEACRAIVLRYTAEWESVVKRMGRWVDFGRGYKTMDINYMESIWWVFKQLWDKGLIYEGFKVLPYCPRCSTPLSNFEANQGYKEVEDPAITIKFSDSERKGLSYLAWTTTPWTLPSNLALAVGPEIDYVEIEDKGENYILAEARLSSYYKDPSEYNLVSKFKGKELQGRKYLPLFQYFEKMRGQGAFKIITADFVSVEDGTGIVHCAPSFGEDDARAAKIHSIPGVCPIDEECKFTSEVPEYAGRYVKDTDKEIIRRLKDQGKLVHRASIRHNYPHCWRDDVPLIYRSISTWFVKIEQIKEDMLAANSQINWTPQHLRDGRFGKWLENARDWAISRNRYWGCPLPIWRNKRTGEATCFGSVAELEKASGQKINDIHMHFLDKIQLPSGKNNAEKLSRVPEVLDCWFESGAMPYAQQHYPFENKKHFEANFPAEFIAEGLDQTRGWFYTLVVLGAALFKKPAFKNVVVNGLILAEDGQKMSKRKKNYPDPKIIFDRYGADSMRLFMLGSPVVRAEDLKFSENGIKEVMRSVLIPAWNSYSFLVTYANLDKWSPQDPPAPPKKPANPLDKWILSSLSEMTVEIMEHMDNYRLQPAACRFEKFIDDLTNWYIRRSRRRFWKSQNDQDKNEAYQTLHYVLLTFCKTAAPFIPFITDAMYRNLRTPSMPESVHLCQYPEAVSERDQRLEQQMDITIKAVSLGRFIRAKHSVKTRQPLNKAVVAVPDTISAEMVEETKSIIAEELNVKNIYVSRDDSELVNVSAKANFKLLGPKLGQKMKEAAAKIAKLSPKEIRLLEKGQNVETVFNDGEKFTISMEDILITREERQGLSAASESGITVAMDMNIDDELKAEGAAREIVSKIQNLRKEKNFDVSDRIHVRYSTSDPSVRTAFAKFAKYISDETLALSMLEDEEKNDKIPLDADGLNFSILIFKES